MDPADKDLLISRRPDLVENIDITNGLLTHLLSRKVLNQRMVQSITYNKPPDRQVEELLDLLPKRGQNAFKLFCESLIATDQEDVVTNILQKSADDETASTASTSSSAGTTVSVPVFPPPSLVSVTQASEAPLSVSTTESLPVLDGSSSVQAASASGDFLLHVSSVQASPPSPPHKRKPVRHSREALENDDKSVLLSPSETDSSPVKRLRPESASVICIRGDNENVIKIYNPLPDEKGDHQEKNMSKSSIICQESVPSPGFVPQDVSASNQSCYRGEEVRHVMKHFVLKDSEQDKSQEEHLRLASTMLADLPQDLLKLVSGGTYKSPSKMRRVDDFSSEIMRERLSRSDSIDTMETRKPQNLRLDVGRKPGTAETDQPDRSAVVVERVSASLPAIPVMKPGDGPVHVHVEECTRQFYNQNKDKSYRMIGMPRGQALIINVNEVLEKPPRRGTDIDRDNLKNLLEQLHFQVTIYNDEDDLTALGMAEKLRAFARKPEHATADACMICLLSHGEEGYMFGTDGKKIPLDEVFLLFDNRHCPSLLNKPKIFFIQACRGGMLDQGVKVKLDEPDGGSPGHNNNIQQHPSMSDMLICYPTLQGYYAWRNREKGSWYIEAVVKVFMKYAKCEDICAMLNRVNSDVSRKVSRTPQMEMDRMSQMSEYKSSLRKPYLFFFPGIGAPSL